MALASPTSGRPYTSRSRRQRHQAGLQTRACGQLGCLLAARVAGAAGQVDLGEPRRRGARGLGQDGAGDGVAAQVAVAGARDLGGQARDLGGRARDRQRAVGRVGQRRVEALGAAGRVRREAQRVEHRAVDGELALGQLQRLGAQLAGARAQRAMRSWRSAQRRRPSRRAPPRARSPTRATSAARRAGSGRDLVEELSSERSASADARQPRSCARWCRCRR